MNVNVMVNDYPYTGVCLFIELDEPNTFEDDPQDTFEQGNWIIPLHILFVPN
jgi:hypothetical protein